MDTLYSKTPSVFSYLTLYDSPKRPIGKLERGGRPPQLHPYKSGDAKGPPPLCRSKKEGGYRPPKPSCITNYNILIISKLQYIIILLHFSYINFNKVSYTNINSKNNESPT